MPSNSAFQFNSKTIFATYPQSDGLDKETILNVFVCHGILEYACVGQEKHAEGGIHFHVAARYASPVRTRDPRFFDIKGYHPNIQGARNFQAVVDYCQKEKDFIEHGENRGIKRSWSDLLDKNGDKESFMTDVMMHFPRDYVLNTEKLLFFADYKYKPIIGRYISPDYNFIVPDILDDWFLRSLARPRLPLDSRVLSDY